VTGDVVSEWFGAPEAVSHYGRAAVSLGLWRAEELVFSQVFNRDWCLLDVGCGTGRIAFGLWRMGFRRVRGIDSCPPMIDEARRLAVGLGMAVDFEVGDATDLRVAAGAFDGAIFGFNGLMQIPGRGRRRQALAQLRRVVRAGGRLVFTTHDRDLVAEQPYWVEERLRWQRGEQRSDYTDFGDRVLERPEGRIFMHLPDRTEVLDDLVVAGWTHEADHLRSQLANESAAVRDFSDECRFWVARS
jgi:SAM-dependent methyltransferase